MSTASKNAAGITPVPFGTFYRSASTSSGVNVSETSITTIDVTDMTEAVLLVNATSIGTTATLTIKVYQLDQAGARYPDAAIISRAITSASKTRDTIATPLGNKLEITYTITGQTGGTTTFIAELQLKAR